MSIKEVSERLRAAANTLNKLTVSGVENARVVAVIYDHINESANMLDEMEGDHAEE